MLVVGNPHDLSQTRLQNALHVDGDDDEDDDHHDDGDGIQG